MSYFWANDQGNLVNPPGGFITYLSALSTHRSGRWLDVGCNRGWLAAFIENYTGLDPNERAIDFANGYWSQRENLKDSITGKNFIVGKAEALPFSDFSFDVVFLKDVLEHSKEPIKVLEEANRVLKRGGLVFLSTPDAQRWVWNDPTHLRPFPRNAHRSLASMTGFFIDREIFESVMPGTQHVARLFSFCKCSPLNLLASFPAWPRNVISILRKA